MSSLNHVALLTASIEDTVNKLELVDADLSRIEEFESEGTRELYIGGDDQDARLLLMQPIGKGPYQSALERRGEGLHHIAIDVKNIDQFVESVCGSGWLLHPKSLHFYKSIQQVWLARPDVSCLVEVNLQRKALPSYIEAVELAVPERKPSLISVLNCGQVSSSTNAKSSV